MGTADALVDDLAPTTPAPGNQAPEGHAVEDQGRQDPPPSKRLSLAIPAEVHRLSKAAAYRRGATFSGDIVELMSARLGLTPYPPDVVAQVRAQIAAEDREIEAADPAGPPVPGWMFWRAAWFPKGRRGVYPRTSGSPVAQ
ncbi:hypothetical protein ACIGO9_29960 [Nocardia asteroides]|uniref:hypothetical protein n=1 Tax=Nocardia asteroides TaxID=1824 RepID=UPI0037C9F298